eukprot:3816498-Alexandrium_andersonii.AAC.1
MRRTCRSKVLVVQARLHLDDAGAREVPGRRERCEKTFDLPCRGRSLRFFGRRALGHIGVGRAAL